MLGESIERIAFTPLQESYALQRQSRTDQGPAPDRELYELFCSSFDAGRFECALEELCRTHPMLTAVFSVDEGFQQVGTKGAVPIVYHDVEGSHDKSSEQVENLKQKVFSERAPQETALQAVHVVRFPDGSASILTLTDGIGMDGESQHIMVRDLGMLYQGDQVEEECPFGRFVDYLNTAHDAAETERARGFWKGAVPVEAEGFALTRCAPPIQSAETVRIAHAIGWDERARFEEVARGRGLTSFALLLSLYLRVLDRYSEAPSFLLLMPRSLRPYELEGIENTVGMCADFFVYPWQAANGPETLGETADRVQGTLWDLQDHAALSGPDTVRLLQERKGAPIALPWSFTAVLPGGESASFAPFSLKSVRVETASLDVETLVLGGEDGFDILTTYRPDRVDGDLLERVIRRFFDLVRSVCDDAGVLDVEELGLGSDEQAVVDSANGDESDAGPALADLLLESVRAHWDEPAIIAEGRAHSYGEVWACAAQIAEDLLAWKRDACGLRIGILMEKGLRQIEVALGVVFAGIAYMPIEATLPADGIAWCIEHAQVNLIVADRSLQEKVASIGVPVIDGNRWDGLLGSSIAEAWAAKASTWSPAVLNDPDGAAVIINTSGTTGYPKSVLLGEAGIVNCLVHSRERFALDSGVSWRALAVTSFCHDMSLFDYLGMLALGGSTVVPDSQRVRDQRYLASLICDYGVNFWNSVPALFEMALASESSEAKRALGHLKRVVLGGDWIRLATAEAALSLSDEVRAFSVGGPTETTIWNISHPIEREDIERGFVPYGRPFPNAKYHLLDGRLRECPLGVAGTMFIEGVGVATGYAGDPEQTALRFRTVRRARMFESGDRGVRLPDGSIRFMGRADNQVKVHGKRIELGGIERRVTELSSIEASCCVLHRETGRIALFYVGSPAPAEVRSVLESRLIDYMVPAYIVALEALPLTYNGKPDRKALAEWKVGVGRGQSEEACCRAATEGALVEEQVCSLLAETLHLDRVAPDDNYYFIGGDSVAAMQFISKLYRSMGVELEVYDVLNNPIVADWIPLVEERLAARNEDSGDDFVLATCRAHLPDKDIGDATSLVEMGGNEQDALALASAFGLTWFEVLALPWPDCWRRARDAHEARR